MPTKRKPPGRDDEKREKPDLYFKGEDGGLRADVDLGESLVLGATGLAPLQPHEILVLDDRGRQLFPLVLLSDQHGRIEPTDLWPQVGLNDPFSERPLTIEEAVEQWRGRRITVELRQDGATIMRQELPLAPAFARPLLAATDADGRLLNAVEAGRAEAIVSAFNVPFSGRARLFMVPRQRGWTAGDRLSPVALDGGRPGVLDLEVPHHGRIRAAVAAAHELRPGAYDFVLRRVRYGYEDDDDLYLRPDDLVTRRLTGLVVREDFMASKVLLGGCVNLLQVGGRPIAGAPYFQHTDTFQIGEDVYGALDPVAVDPAMVGKMVALYVVASKTAAQWSADNSLSHLAVLGGNAAVQRIPVQPGCINFNTLKLWPAASLPGEYDVVCDFGNNTSVPADFKPDNKYDMPLDIIDGYLRPGFRIVPDPTVDTSFPHAGTFEYDETTQGSVVVAEEGGWNVPLRAAVFFPADVPGATTIAQLSAKQATYPLVVAVHGNSTFETGFRGYNYLLQHLARNGFIAASIYQKYNMYITGRARVLRKHLDILFGMFGSRVANNVGIMGHSRGGEAVYQAAGLNKSEAWGYNLNAVISLASLADDAKTYAVAWKAPFLVIHGSLDGDLSGPWDVGFELYDHAAPPKSMAYVYGACHTRFNTEWGETDVTGGNVHPTDRARIISADAHQKIARGYMAAFFRQHLRNEPQWGGIFRGEWIPAAVQMAVPGLRICMQYEDPTVRTVDDFEGAHSATSWETSTIGGAVSQTGLPAVPKEDDLEALDLQSPHETAGLRLGWNGLTGALKWDVPPGQRDVRGFAALSFRIGQTVGATNPVGQPQHLRVTLVDVASRSRAVLVSKFAEVPYPEQQVYTSYMMSAMRTVRIPLHAYTIRCLGLPEVDLKHVVAVRFELSETAKGDVSIDSIQFTA